MARRKIRMEDFENAPGLRSNARRSKEVARALDEKADLPHAMIFTNHEFETFLHELTPRRFELLRLASKGSRLSIGDLALASHRDQSAVSRDVARLTKLGLVRVESVPNAGHGQKKIVSAVARSIAINASIAAV